MITIQLLEDNDIITGEEWCRPLSITTMSSGMSDHYSFKSMYSGTPENNVKWVKSKDVIGHCWFGRTVAEYHRAIADCGNRMEFVLGDIPSKHRLNMQGYNSLAKRKRENELYR
jgi:hypothetical protein